MLNYIVNTEYCSYHEQDIIFFKSEQIKIFSYRIFNMFYHAPSRATTFPDIAQIIPKLSLPSKVRGVWLF